MTTPLDPLDRLTLAELDAGSRLLKADMVSAINRQTADRWQALAILAWLLGRREDPAAVLTTYRAMTAPDLIAVLDLDGPAAPGERVWNPGDPALLAPVDDPASPSPAPDLAPPLADANGHLAYDPDPPAPPFDPPASTAALTASAAADPTAPGPA